MNYYYSILKIFKNIYLNIFPIKRKPFILNINDADKASKKYIIC